MPKGMLGMLSLDEVRGPRDTLEERLAGSDGEFWLSSLKQFLKKEACWLTNDCFVIDGDQGGRKERWDTCRVGNEKIGKFKWDLGSAVLRDVSLSPEQAACSDIDIYRLVLKRFREEEGGLVPANISVMDFLFRNPGLIPEEWIGTNICFWGSVYARSNEPENLYIPYLHYDQEQKRWMDSKRRILPATAKRRSALLLMI